MRGDLRLGHVQWKERCLFSVLEVASAEPASGCVGKAHLTLSMKEKYLKTREYAKISARETKSSQLQSTCVSPERARTHGSQEDMKLSPVSLHLPKLATK